MSDTMRIAYNLNMRYVDILNPIQNVSAEEIVADVMLRGGLSFEHI